MQFPETAEQIQPDGNEPTHAQGLGNPPAEALRKWTASNRFAPRDVSPEGQRLRASQLVRALKKVAYDTLRKPQEPKPQTEKNPNDITVRILVDNRNEVVPYIRHGKIHEFAVDTTKSAHMFRNQVARRFRLKPVVWTLERRNSEAREGFELGELVAYMAAKEGDEFLLMVMRAKTYRPNSPGTTKRVKRA
jgi:hypothetical protein